MTTKTLEVLEFENRAWEKASSPRLCIKDYFKHSDGLHYFFEIGWHHGKNSWCLHVSKGEMNQFGIVGAVGFNQYFQTIKPIKEFIKKQFNRDVFIPNEEKWKTADLKNS